MSQTPDDASPASTSGNNSANGPNRASSFFSMATAAMKRGVGIVGSGVDVVTKPIRRKMADKEVEEFYKTFEFPPEEKLFAEYGCYAVAAEGKMRGTIYLSQRYISFLTERADKKIKVVISFSNIERIQPAISVTPEKDPSAPIGQPSVSLIFKPYDPQDQDSPKPDAVQIFTKDRMIHQFFSIAEFTKFLNLTDFLHACAAPAYTYDAPPSYPPPVYPN